MSLHSHLLALILVLIAVGLSGCATHPPPGPTTPANSAIGIRLDVRAPVSLFPFEVEKVLFVKLDDSEAASVVVERIIPSNYAQSGYHYLLDAPPGRYAIVGVYDTGERSAITIEKAIPISDNVEMWVGFELTFHDVYTVYFSEALVRETESVVPPGSVVFLGDYRINTDAGLKGADAVQAHYFEMLHPGQEIKSIGSTIMGSMLGGGQFDYRATLVKVDKGGKARSQFREHVESLLAGSGWDTALDDSRPAVDAEAR
jgi:hypothetical protein